nr:hypothetical protein [bacterium]
MTRMATRRSKRIAFRHLWDAAWSHTLWVGGQLTLLLVLTALFFTAASSLCDIRRIT